MNQIDFIFLMSLTILFPALAGIIRYGQIDSRFKPFIWVFISSLASEVIRYLLVKKQMYGYEVYNINYLVTTILYIHLFYYLNKINRNIFIGLIIISVLFWIIEHIYVGSLGAYTKYFRIYQSILLVVLGVIAISKEISKNVQEVKLYKNALVIICTTLIFYNIYKLILVPFSNTGTSYSFQAAIFGLNKYFLIASYIIFTIAILWIPKKKNFSLQL